MESTTHEALRGNQIDYSVNLLYMMCLQVNVMLAELLVSPKVTHLGKKWYFITTDCPGCMQDVGDHALIMTGKAPVAIVSANNPYLTLTPGELEDLHLSIERGLTQRAINQMRQDPLLDTTRSFNEKVEIARQLVGRDLLVRVSTFRAQVQNEHTRSLFRSEILPLSEIDATKPNYNDLRSLPPKTWAELLCKTLGHFVMSYLRTHSFNHALRNVREIPATAWPYHDLVEALRAAWLDRNILACVKNIGSVAPSYSAYQSTTEFQVICALSGLSKGMVDNNLIIYLWDITTVDGLTSKIQQLWFTYRIKILEKCMKSLGLAKLELSNVTLRYFPLVFSIGRLQLRLFSCEDLEQDEIYPVDLDLLTFDEIAWDLPPTIHGDLACLWEILYCGSYSHFLELGSYMHDAFPTDEQTMSLLDEIILACEASPISIKIFSKAAAYNLAREGINPAWYQPPEGNLAPALVSPTPLATFECLACSIIGVGDETSVLGIPVLTFQERDTLKDCLDLSYIKRPVGANVSSASKLVELVWREDQVKWLKQQRRALCLADGAGGYAAALCQICPDLQASVVTLQQEEIIGRFLAPLSEPAAWGVADRVTTPGLHLGVHDLTHDITVDYLSTLPHNDIITMDAEHGGDPQVYNLILSNSCSIIAKCLRPGGLAILKSFLSNDSEIYQFINGCLFLFEQVSLVKQNLQSGSLNVLLISTIKGMLHFSHVLHNLRSGDYLLKL
jgi:hypothetical protein